jgi:formylmethanofuran dehydrogenase subunit E
MSCTYTSEEIEQTIAFHGQSCPGLTIGIRAAELVRQNLGSVDPADLLAVVETDMCGVDAIQYLTGCTIGKGNLIHKDVGR